MLRKYADFLNRLARSARARKKEAVHIPVCSGELLQGRRALVTGGTKGIGFAIAQAFAKEGARVVITSRTAESAAAAARGLNACTVAPTPSCEAGMVCGIAFDGRDVRSVKEKWAEAEAAAGGPIDILVNNAGVNIHKGLWDFTEEDFDQILSLNLKGSFFLAREAARNMLLQKTKGNILNVCSSSSLRPAVSPYTLSKWGMRALTLGLAKTLVSHGIVVNGVAPGPTHTPLHVPDGYDGLEEPANPTGRMADAQEIAAAAVYLVSDFARMVIGDVLYVTGGAGVITFDDVNYSLQPLKEL